MSPPRSYKIGSARLQLNITEWGDPSAPPLLLQHGGRDHGRSWDVVAEAFAGDYRVIAPDLRGHGDSDWSGDGAYDLIDFLQDFATVARALDLPPCAIIGHSLGGNIATRFAGLYPHRVTRLINIEGLGSVPAVEAARAARDETEILRESIEQRAINANNIPRRYTALAPIAARLRQGDPWLTPEFAEHLARHAARADADGGYTIKHDPGLRGSASFDIPAETRHRLWASVTCPVLLVYGAQSWATSPAIDGRAAYFRDARVELLENAGHWVHHDRQADFIAMARDFLAA